MAPRIEPTMFDIESKRFHKDVLVAVGVVSRVDRDRIVDVCLKCRITDYFIFRRKRAYEQRQC
ncbi:hypothetical protein EMIT0111MI5_80001 [Burkholderia sp. IT-111MI5]